MQTPFRVAAVFVAMVGVVLAGAGSALADAPATWLDPKPTSTLHELVFFGGSTVGLIIVITLFALVLTRRNYTPPPPPPRTDVEVHSGH